jgi:hypothetical protein
MTHVTQQTPSHPIAVALASAKLSVNIQVSNQKGNPNPTLLQQLSNGTILLGNLNSSLALNGWGGE